MVKERLEQQRMERKKLKEATVNAMNAASSNHRSGREPPQKPIRPHIETGNAKTSFFSHLSPDMIEEALVNYLNQRSITAK